MPGEVRDPDPDGNHSQQTISELVEGFSREFDVRAMERHQMGAAKYGPIAFLGVDVYEEAMQEVLDLGNYARYIFIKMRLLQWQLEQEANDGA